jgi:DNA polymerase I-like protein with 3'-5' exonuclease and polymerase domains
MSSIVFDIEANGLLEDGTQIWCIVTKDLKTGVVVSGDVTDGKLENVLEILTSATILIGHNIINYDIQALKKLLNWSPSEDTIIFDTLVTSRLLNPDRKKPSNPACKGGPHSLEAWGYRLGRGKPDHKDWTVFSPAMLRRCQEDVEITAMLYSSLQEEMKGHNWKEALEIEHRVAEIITQQEINGVYFDVDNARYVSTGLTIDLCQTYLKGWLYRTKLK